VDRREVGVAEVLGHQAGVAVIGSIPGELLVAWHEITWGELA
jgi:hypothetical protein